MKLFAKIFKKKIFDIFACMALILFCSCSAVYDDLEACPQGANVRFIFDYNLEFANSFHKQVDCLTVYIFDNDGNLIERRQETSEVLADEDWRMTFDLPAGTYKAVAYGGLECEMASFSHSVSSDQIKKIEDLDAVVNPIHIGEVSSRPAAPLHDLFYGAQQFTVTDGLTYDNINVEMMRNTNHLRIALQHIDGSPVDFNDFKVEVIDDNSKFNHENDVIPNGEVTYTPWSEGNSMAGVVGTTKAAEGMPVQVAYSELSLSRLMYRSDYSWTRADGVVERGPRLRITALKDGHTVADLPLNNYLLLMKSDYFSKMDNQEYLDRSYRHNLIFFLNQGDQWVRMNIVVDDWTVKVNNIELAPFS